MIDATPAAGGEWSAPDVEGFKWLKPRLPGGTYYIYRGSRHKKISLKTKNLEEAKKLYIAQIGQPIPDDRVTRCGKAFDAYLLNAPLTESTKARYGGLWNNYAKEYLATKRVAEVEPRDIIQVLEAMTTSARNGRPLSGASRRNCYVMLTAFFSSCTEEPTVYRTDNPVSRIGRLYRPPTPESTAVAEEVVISDAEISEIGACLRERGSKAREKERIAGIQHEMIVHLQSYIGARLGEVLALRLTDWNRFVRPYEEVTIERQVNLRAKANDPTTWVTSLKGRKGTVGDVVRIVPLHPRVVERLAAYVAQGMSEGWLQPGGLLFPTTAMTPRNVSYVSTAISRAGRDVLGRRFVSHYFRHTFASRLLEAGGHLAQISELLGNSEDVCRKRYAHRADRAAFNTQIIGLLDVATS